MTEGSTEISPSDHLESKADISEKGRELKSLFRKSFKFSQGEIGVQTNIFRWLRQNNYLDSFTIPTNPPAFIHEIEPPAVHGKVSEFESTKDTTIENAWEALYEVASGKDKITVTKNYLLSSIVERDLHFQFVPREGRLDTDAQPDSLHDPHASFLRKYSLHNETTGSKAFDQLFLEIRDPLIAGFSGDIFDFPDPDMILSIRALRDTWDKNHKVTSKLLDPDYKHPTFYTPEAEAA